MIIFWAIILAIFIYWTIKMRAIMWNGNLSVFLWWCAYDVNEKHDTKKICKIAGYLFLVFTVLTYATIITSFFDVHIAIPVALFIGVLIFGLAHELFVLFAIWFNLFPKDEKGNK